MTSRLNPYLSFNGTARAAMEFYKTVFGGKLVLNTFKESGTPTDPSEENKIMHAMLEAENNMILMGSDAMGTEYHAGSNVSLSLSGDNETELKGYWDKLSVGATITQPLVKAPWGDTFGMLTDSFGMEWMVNITGQKA